MIALLDVNVLIALAWPNHVHHTAARRWFRDRRDSGWATCPTTQSGFIRVSSDKAITPEARTPREAALLLLQLTAVGRHESWHEDVFLTEERWVPMWKVTSHGQVTDAHLVSLALNRGGRLATFDRGIVRLVPGNLAVDQVLELIPFEHA